jgi:glutathione S-transferase
VRRLVDWFHGKANREATGLLLAEKVYGRLAHDVPVAPDPAVLRVALANLRHHLAYVNFLAHDRDWLAGDHLSLADLAAAAEISVADYLGDVAWAEVPFAKSWYQRMKSRPSMRPLLADKLPGMAPAVAYANLDF